MKRMIAVILCLMLAACILPAVFAEEANHTIHGKTFRRDGWRSNAVHFFEGSNAATGANALGAWVFSMDGIPGPVGYCIQPGRGINDLYEGEGSRGEYDESLLKTYMQQGSPYTGNYDEDEMLQLRRAIRLTMQYGFHGTVTEDMADDDLFKACATQLIIFELVVGERDLTGAMRADRTGLNEPLHGYYNDLILKGVDPFYDDISQKLIAALAVPEDATPDHQGDEPAGKTFEMVWNGSDYTVTVPDAADWEVDTEKSPKGVTGTVSGASLILHSSKPFSQKQAIYLKKDMGKIENFTILVDKQGRPTQVVIMPHGTDEMVIRASLSAETPRPAELTVTKTVSDNSTTAVFSVKVNVDTAGIGLTGTFNTEKDVSGIKSNGTVTFVNGSAALTIRNGEKITITDLPAGASYSVEETGAQNYDVTYTGKTGMLEAGKTATAGILNVPKATPTPSPSPSPSPSPTPSPSPSPSSSPTPTASPSPSPSPTPTVSPSPTPTVSQSPTPTASPSPTPAVSPSPTPTVSPSPTPTASPGATPSATPTASPSATPTVSPSPTPPEELPPETGDSSRPVLWMSIMTAALGMLLLAFAVLKRDEKRR